MKQRIWCGTVVYLLQHSSISQVDLPCCVTYVKSKRKSCIVLRIYPKVLNPVSVKSNDLTAISMPSVSPLATCWAWCRTRRKDLIRFCNSGRAFLRLACELPTSWDCPSPRLRCSWLPIVPASSFWDGTLTLQSLVVTIYTTRFNTLKLCILPTECICVFRMVLTINSDCSPKQH
jgi:hypothetical protein